MTGARLLKWAVRLHPARYRAEFGAELEEAALASMAGRPRAGVLAEAAHLAVHGVRLRLRLGADRPLGHAAAAAAPLVLALGAAGEASTRIFQVRIFRRALTPDQLNHTFGLYPAWAGVGLTVLALLALLAGRVTAARLLGTGALLASVASGAVATAYSVGGPLAGVLNPLLVCAFLWLAPLRLTPAPGLRTGLLAVGAGLLALGVLLAVPGSNHWGVVDAAFVLAAGLAAARTRQAARIALLALLPLYPVAFDQFGVRSLATTGTLRAGLLLAAATALALRLSDRRTDPSDARPPAAP